MKKRVIVVAGIVVIAMSGLSTIALSIADDAQWSPYVLRWDQKLPPTKKENKQVASIPICSSKKDQKVFAKQR
jgi:hypothetical protein